MLRQLQIISAQPNDSYFIWQLRVQLSNFRKYGYSANYRILVFKHNDRDKGEDFADQWRELENDYPEAKFFYYEDPDKKLLQAIKTYDYIPILRPWLLAKHFKEYPELSKDAILYMDSDVVFTKYLDFTPFLEDDVCYLSDTRSYINSDYFDSKIKDVLPEKLEEYKAVDCLNTALGMVNLTREVAVANKEGSGGAQYLLKNIDHTFWENVFAGCAKIRTCLRSINRKYFENEDKGFQSWCADMWSVLWNLWARGYQTKCPVEMDFAWATDDISKWDRVYLYHDAGASTKPIKEGHRLFHKRESRYINNEKMPFYEDLTFVSDEYCSKKYVEEIIAARPHTEWRTYQDNEIFKEENEKMRNMMMWGPNNKT